MTCALIHALKPSSDKTHAESRVSCHKVSFFSHSQNAVQTYLKKDMIKVRCLSSMKPLAAMPREGGVG